MDAARWRALDAELRPFVARRVRDAADVDDVVQDVMLRMHRGLSTLRDDERLGAWMYRIARTAIVDHARVRARHPLRAGDDLAEPAEDGFARAAARPDVSDETCGAGRADGDADEVPARLAATLAFFIAHLPSPYREAITLTELEGRSQREAAAMLGVSLPALKSQVLRGRARLRDMLDRCCAIAVDARGRPIECIPRQPPRPLGAG